jgi:plastocyanin
MSDARLAIVNTSGRPLIWPENVVLVMTTNTRLDRRTTLKATGGLLAGMTLAGCSSDDGGNGNGNGDSDRNTVAVGPGGDFRFDPEEITVSTGETVTWEFESASHNVSGWPEMFPDVSIPEDADGFGTMSQGESGFTPVDSGETFEHTFETAGEYTYVCGPHVEQNMIGTVVVE